MNDKLSTLIDHIKQLCESDLDRIISFVADILSASIPTNDRPECPRCRCVDTIKFGQKDGKQRFKCKGCGRTFTPETGTFIACSHQSRSVWLDFIRHTLSGMSLDYSAGCLGFCHTTAFNMRHKLLAALQDWLRDNPVILSDIVELDETFVLESLKGTKIPEGYYRKPRKHGAKALKRGISNEQIAICTGVQRSGGIVAKTVNRAKPSSQEVASVFGGHIADDTLLLTDGLRSYNILKGLSSCTVVTADEKSDDPVINLNTVNSLHSFIKRTYNHYRGVATKYLNRYNALFSVAFRCLSSTAGELFDSISSSNSESYWHSCKDIRLNGLLLI